MNDVVEAKRAALGILGGRRMERQVSTAEWGEIAAMAAAHRLEPLLHWRAQAGGWALPEHLAAAWATAHRSAALAALAQQAALRLAVERLTAAGIATVALKGVRLAWRDYPAPALRPMRDLDLLVSPHQALDGFAILAQAGFAPEPHDAAVLVEALASGHELPHQHHAALRVTIELHHRLTDPPGSRSYRVPQFDAAAVHARAEPLELGGARLACPAADDLLAHLVVHALYAHRLDCGPLVLADIHFLAADPTLDAARFRAQAEAGGWARGADLLLALTARWFGAVPLPFTTPPEAVLAAAEEALLADPAGRRQAELFAELSAARSPGALAGALARRFAPDRRVVTAEGAGQRTWQFWPRWAARRIGSAAASLAGSRTRREARQAAAVLRWLEP